MSRFVPRVSTWGTTRIPVQNRRTHRPALRQKPPPARLDPGRKPHGMCDSAGSAAGRTARGTPVRTGNGPAPGVGESPVRKWGRWPTVCHRRSHRAPGAAPGVQLLSGRGNRAGEERGNTPGRRSRRPPGAAGRAHGPPVRTLNLLRKARTTMRPTTSRRNSGCRPLRPDRTSRTASRSRDSRRRGRPRAGGLRRRRLRIWPGTPGTDTRTAAWRSSLRGVPGFPGGWHVSAARVGRGSPASGDSRRRTAVTAGASAPRKACGTVRQ